MKGKIAMKIYDTLADLNQKTLVRIPSPKLLRNLTSKIIFCKFDQENKLRT